MSAHTPWTYRPNKHDDWGWIRDASGELAACARGDDGSKSHDQHRLDKTDPYGEYAALIIRAVNRDHHFDALVKALEGLLPWLEDAETKCLVGDEGCVWAVEHVRDILASVGSPREPGK